MALPPRHRWMLYALCAALTAAAMVAVQPADDPIAAPAVVRTDRPGRGARDPAREPAPAPLADLPRRPFAAAGRSPFGDAAPGAALRAAGPEAPPPAAMEAAPPVPPPAAAAEEPFTYLGRWTEDGETTVFLARGAQRLAARAGRPLTPEYRVESIGERELRLFHLPTRTRRTLVLATGAAASPPHGAPPTAPPPEELN